MSHVALCPALVGRVAAALLLMAGLTGAAAQDLTLLARRWLDVEAGVLRPATLIRIEEGRLATLTPFEGPEVPVGVLDLGDLTVMPGLIDVHTHLCDETWRGRDWDPWTLPAPGFGIVGVVNARRVLEAGFTTVRNLSEPFYAGVALRDAVAAGAVPGPRILASGPMITMTGGHGDWGTWMGPPHDDSTPAEAVADGVDAVRRQTREHLKHGVDWIKVAATGGFGTSGTVPGAASYTVEEMAAAVDEAAKRGRRVAAHAHGAEGIANAIAAGVASIEHGTLLDESSIQLMLEHDVVLVPDLLGAHYDLVEQDGDWSEKGIDDNLAAYRDFAERVGRAHRAGVAIAFGSDAGASPHGRGAEQFALLVEAGLPPAAALRSATVVAADLLGLGDRIGRLEPGLEADLIAVPGDPLTDVAVLTDVRFVMQAGQVHLWHRDGGEGAELR